MQKKALTSIINKNSNRVIMAFPKASFHASKAANVEVIIRFSENI
jgi:hypothetical protein